jgi:Caspase domain
VQINGRNYLLPVDINLRDEEEIKDDSVDVDDVFVSRIERARTQVRIVILDACRDNPFRRARQVRPLAGLAEMSARGTLIAYSSAPGAPAADGPPGTNSVYTRHLASEMLVEGVEVEQMFKNVRVKVLRDSQDRQVPWDNSSLTARFSFNPSRGIAREDSGKQAEVRALRERIEQMARDQRVAERRTPESHPVVTATAPMVKVPVASIVIAPPKPEPAAQSSRRNEAPVLVTAKRSIAPRPQRRCADMLVQFQLGGSISTDDCHSTKE